jgi:hypothetical protein
MARLMLLGEVRGYKNQGITAFVLTGGPITEKKILMAVDVSIHSNQSMRYATHILSGA